MKREGNQIPASLPAPAPSSTHASSCSTSFPVTASARSRLHPASSTSRDTVTNELSCNFLLSLPFPSSPFPALPHLGELEDARVIHAELPRYRLDEEAVGGERDEREPAPEHFQLLNRPQHVVPGHTKALLRPDLETLTRAYWEMVSRRVLWRERSKRCLISSSDIIPTHTSVRSP